MAERVPRTTQVPPAHMPGAHGAVWDVESPEHGTAVDVVERLLSGVREARDGMGGLFPPVVGPGPRGSVRYVRELTGPADAEALARTLALPEFQPVLRSLRSLGSWCARHAPDAEADGLLAPGLLTATNGGLFGPLINEIFATCAGAPSAAPRADTETRTAWWQRFLVRFLRQLARDRAALAVADPGLSGPITDLRAHGDETHNGGRRVLRVTFAGGGRVAYKDRPAGGEALVTAARTAQDGAPPSVFALLNELPPVSGPVRLPVLTVVRTDPYGPTWQEWVEPPPRQGVLLEEEGHRLIGPVLEPDQARDFWRGAGELAAVSFGLGLVDLTADNVLTGRRAGGDETVRPYAVDSESFLADVHRLHHTALTGDGTVAGTHHVGFEARARWCGLGDPALVWRPEPGGLRLGPPGQLYAHTTTRSVVADTDGATGYGLHLTALFRGMFDAWTLLCRHRDRVLAQLTERAPTTYRRAILRPTSEYHVALTAGQVGKEGEAGHTRQADDRFAAAERDQLADGDVPYFLQRMDGGPLLALSPGSGPGDDQRLIEVDTSELPTVPMPDAAHHHARLTLAGLGAALRDAAEGVFDTLTERGRHDLEAGVTIRLDSPHDGYASFDWPAAGRRITYLWGPVKLRLRVEDLGQPAEPVPVSPGVEIRSRLLRLNQLDATLRTPWAADGFTDRATTERLGVLTHNALTWLRDVVEAHGWPGERLVGAEAAGAACRLVQHATNEPDFRAHCLSLIREAVRTGDVPARELAYLTDAVCLDEGRPQRYGTKFHDVAGTLRPFPLDEPEAVDARRAELGLEPLERYAARLGATFGLAAEPVPAEPVPVSAPATPGLAPARQLQARSQDVP